MKIDKNGNGWLDPVEVEAINETAKRIRQFAGHLEAIDRLGGSTIPYWAIMPEKRILS